MQEVDKIIRAWKDEDYRSSLSTDEQRALPENPAGLIELTEEDLKDAAGGTLGLLTLLFLPGSTTCLI
jgi:mersacidin/lichenicidin family type 2 lantibiotic